MATSADVYNQMMQAQAKIDSMKPASSTDITRDLMARVNNLEPQFNELAGLEAAAYSTPATALNQYNQQFGASGGYGPNAMQRLQSVLGLISGRIGTANVLRNLIKGIRGTIGEQAQTVSDLYQQDINKTQQKYQNLLPIWQTMKSDEAAAAARAAAAAARAAAAKQAQASNDIYTKLWQNMMNQFKTGGVKTANLTPLPAATFAGINTKFNLPAQNVNLLPTQLPQKASKIGSAATNALSYLNNYFK